MKTVGKSHRDCLIASLVEFMAGLMLLCVGVINSAQASEGQVAPVGELQAIKPGDYAH
jgi:hypothetical protein